ncbi:MAG: hypothetical protein SFV17_10225 [Candidatus Obscuribacter sp.]|nr:hypothetical protein [Candidatus Obscuribacter sp.]
MSIVIAEVLFSCSNVLAVESYACDLPTGQRLKALRWGYTGAVLVRAGSLLLMTVIKSYYWILLLASIHMVVGAAFWFLGLSSHGHGSGNQAVKALKPVSRNMTFVKSVLLIELADLGSSFENVAVAVSISKELWVSVTGVAIGLLLVRFYWRHLRMFVMKSRRLADTSELVSGLLGIQILGKLLLNWKPSPWLDFLTVAVAIVCGQACRRLGTRLKLRASVLLFALFLSVSVWLHLLPRL